MSVASLYSQSCHPQEKPLLYPGLFSGSSAAGPTASLYQEESFPAASSYRLTVRRRYGVVKGLKEAW